MQSQELTLELLDDPSLLIGLAEDAKADGRRMAARLIREWQDGSNRFCQPGERAYIARWNGRVCGVCGLNRDPFANDAFIGRVRRMYVSTANRRRGIGSAILQQLMEDSRGIFGWIHLRTDDVEASAFYEAIGFERVIGNAECTHRRMVIA